MWIPIDTRLIDHPKVRSIARRLEVDLLTAVGGLVVLWGIAADLDTERFDGVSHTIEADYRLPAGLLEAMAAVGWADVRGDHTTISTRNQDRSAAASKRREQAQHAARMRWHSEHMREHDAANAAAHARMPHTNRQRKKETDRRASRPAALEEQAGAAAGVGSPAAALRSALATIGKVAS